MDFTFDAQQIEFRDAIQRFLMVEAAPEALRDIWSTRTGRSSELRAKLADQGLTALSVPEEFGGMGLGDLDWMPVQRELGYYAIPDSLSDMAYLAVWALSQLPASVPVRAEWLARIAEGRARIAVGHNINPFVCDAEVADLLLLWRDNELHAVEPESVKLTLNPSIDMSRRLYTVSGGRGTRLCNGRLGKDIGRGLLDRGAFAAACQLLGLAQRMLDLGVDHAAQRKQFGKPIGSFQAVKHQMADVAVAIEFAEPVVQRAAYALAHGESLAAVHVSHARIAAGDAALLAARNSLQAHGAMGYTWEADLQMFMKRAWALDAAWGDRAFHKSRVAAHVFNKDAALGPGATFD